MVIIWLYGYITGLNEKKKRHCRLCDNSQRDVGCWEGGFRKICHVCDFLPCLIGMELVPGKESIALGKLNAPSEQMGKWLSVVKVQTLTIANCRSIFPVLALLCSRLHVDISFFGFCYVLVSPQVHTLGCRWVSASKETLAILSCRLTCPPSWSQSCPGSPSGLTMMPLLLVWPWVTFRFCLKSTLFLQDMNPIEF